MPLPSGVARRDSEAQTTDNKSDEAEGRSSVSKRMRLLPAKMKGSRVSSLALLRSHCLHPAVAQRPLGHADLQAQFHSEPGAGKRNMVASLNRFRARIFSDLNKTTKNNSSYKNISLFLRTDYLVKLLSISKAQA